MRFFHDFRIYKQCPEVRIQIRQMYMAKIASFLTVVILFPLIVIGILSICIVHVFDFIGQIFLSPVHYITDWLYRYQKELIYKAHTKLSPEEIKKRLDDES